MIRRGFLQVWEISNMPQIGENAPDFEMVNDEGKPVKLSDYRGKKVVLYFYPEDFTSGCEAQACNFRDNYEQIAAKNAVVIGVSADPVERHKEFRAALNLPFNLLVDNDWQHAQSWGAWGPRPWKENTIGMLRSQFIIDENGVIVDAVTPVKFNESLQLALEKL
jgi:thioredoxin-dependent peroxiredoxin